MYHTLDLHFLNLEHAIASFLIESSAGPILIESGPYSTFESLKKGLAEKGYQPKDVKHVLLTHIHFDHAGAAWAFAATGANIYMHPFGAQHMQDPGKLVASATRIYGDQMDRLWGKMDKIDPEKIIQVQHKETLQIGDVSFTSLHTPGHARHHIAWQMGKIIFSGDVAGVKIENGPVVPPCPPPDIHIEDWEQSMQVMLDQNPEKLVLTHYGEVQHPAAHLAELTECLQSWKTFVYEAWQSGLSNEEITPKFMQFTSDNFKAQGLSQHAIDQYEAANPSWMSVAGLVRYFKQQAQS